MTSLEQDIATVRAAVGSAAHVADGTSAAFERILVEMKRIADENDERAAYAIEAAEARDMRSDE